MNNSSYRLCQGQCSQTNEVLFFKSAALLFSVDRNVEIWYNTYNGFIVRDIFFLSRMYFKLPYAKGITSMKHIKYALALILSMIMICGCSRTGSSGQDNVHEPITILSSSDIDRLRSIVHEKYPEIVIEIIPYSGRNWSRFTCDQMITGDMPDIYNTTYPWLNHPEEMKANLMDLSTYAFTDNYDPTLLSQQKVDGGIYLLPSKYATYVCAYNKTLFEKHGWKVPKSFEELKALAPEIEKAGVRLSATNSFNAGQGFQYVCNLADTIDLPTIKGVQWQNDFLSGKADARAGFGEAMDYMQEWVDLGFLQGSNTLDGKTSFEIFSEGNTAFAVGGVDRWTQNPDGTGDVYAPMPYLSRDGSKNMFITMTSKNFGLSKKLTEKGNEQKLEDALHVMEVLSTIEGQNSFYNENTTYISSLREWEIDPASPYADCIDEMRNGHTAPLLYVGWEGILARVGENILDYLNGEYTKDEVLDYMDTLRDEWLSEGTPVFSEVDRKYDQKETAQLVGKVFGEAVGADCALISLNAAVDNCGIQNGAGISGYIMPLPLTDERIVSVIPTGWNDNIKTVTLKGSQLKEYAQKGYTIEKDGKSANFPYELFVKGGKELSDDTEYTAVVCGADEELSAAGNIRDSGIQGLQAFKDFFTNSGYPAMSEELLKWND